MSVIDPHSFSVALNIWLDTASEFRKKFTDNRLMAAAANAITQTLVQGLHLPHDDPLHPFNKYTDEEESMEVCLSRLRADVRNSISESSVRGYVSSFFGSGGVNRESMDELWVAYDNFAFDSLQPSSPNAEMEEIDPNAEDEEDEEEEASEDEGASVATGADWEENNPNTAW